MGVPGFFGLIVKRIKPKPLDIKLDRLYIDANCLIHPAASEIKEKCIPISVIEEKIIENVIYHLKKLIKENTNINAKVFIAIDGRAPMAKIKQQRQRRYVSEKETREEKQILDKYGVINSVSDWNNINITPGTKFMKKLDTEIRRWLRKANNIQYSSCYEPGEGEHKILDKVRSNSNEDSSLEIGVYGSDADLIFLALTTNIKYIIRDTYNMPVGHMTMYRVSDLTSWMTDKYKVPKLDLIFLCFLLGNDFVPQLASIEIRAGGLGLLLEAYKTIAGNLVINGTVNIDTFSRIIKYIADRELYYFNKHLPNFTKRWESRVCPYKDAHNITLWERENMLSLEDKNRRQNLGFGKGEWEDKYYRLIFGVKATQADIRRLCKEYYRAFVWILNYYIGNCLSWTWQYPYNRTPLASDFYKYLLSLETNEIKFTDEGALSINEQLVIGTPPSLVDILPKKYKNLHAMAEVSDLFPIDFTLDKELHYMRYQCTPNLPNVDPIRIRNAMSKL